MEVKKYIYKSYTVSMNQFVFIEAELNYFNIIENGGKEVYI